MKSIAFMNVRSGSTLFQHMIKKSSAPLLITKPPEQCKVIPTANRQHLGQTIKTHKQHKNTLWTIHLNDWWPQQVGYQVPAYNAPSARQAVFFDPKFLKTLSPVNWRFAALVRDPRNAAASLLRHPGGIEEKHLKKNPALYFKYVCKAFRNKTQLMLENERTIFVFKIFKAEEMFEHPVKLVTALIKHLGFELDPGLAAARLKSNPGVRQSNFKEVENLNARWKSWPSEQIKIAKEILGEVLVESGYEKDLNWEKR